VTRSTSQLPAAPQLPRTAVRCAAAVAVLVGGLVHLQLYFRGYRSLPDANLGRSFLLNAVASAAVAVALVARTGIVTRLAGVAVSAGTLAAFALSRTGHGVFGLREHGLQPSPQAAVALVAEVAALALLALTFVPAWGAGERPGLRVAASVAAGVMVLVVATGAWWDHTTSAAAAPPTAPSASPSAGAVEVQGFAFRPPALTVAAGTTVTWTNHDDFAHSVVDRAGTFHSEPIAPGTTYQHTFDAPGTYTYICGIHPSMTATVVVTG
jgi:plastocyanin